MRLARNRIWPGRGSGEIAPKQCRTWLVQRLCHNESVHPAMPDLQMLQPLATSRSAIFRPRGGAAARPPFSRFRVNYSMPAETGRRVGLVTGGMTYTKNKETTDLGPIDITVKEKKRVAISPAVSVVAVVGGVVLLLMGSTRRGA